MKIDTVELNDPNEFVKKVNEYLDDGWHISSTSCGFVDSDAYNFVSLYQAILSKD